MLGYGAYWAKNRQNTWSGSPASLLAAIRQIPSVNVRDLHLSEGHLLRNVLRVACLRFHNGRPVSTWRHNTIYRNWENRTLRKSVSELPELDAVLTIGEHGTVSRPLFWYQDLSFVTVADLIRERRTTYQFDRFSYSSLVTMAQRQVPSIQTAFGVFTMSEWDRNYHHRIGAIDPNKIHVVGAGINVPVLVPDAATWQTPDANRERTVLFVGREFNRKGGALVVQAVERWCRGVDYKVRLIVAGPKKWPMKGAIPSWVTFLGDVPYSTLTNHLRKADVFAMPSYFEAFGIAFVEALAAGVPVIGRNDFAMPEFIRHGENGFLLEEDNVQKLAEYIEQASEDNSIRKFTVSNAASIVERFDWLRVANDMVDIIRKSLA